MNCPNCDKELDDKVVRHAKRKHKSLSIEKNIETEHYNIYCDMKCFYEFKGMKKGDKKARICPECGSRKQPKSMRCGTCRSMAVTEFRLDSEIKELVILNSGAGFDYFIDTVFSRGGSKPQRRPIRGRLLIFLQDISEFDGVDYVAWLENPAAMRDINQEECPPEMEKYMRFQRQRFLTTNTVNVFVRDCLLLEKHIV